MSIAIDQDNDVYSLAYMASSHDVAPSEVLRVAAALELKARRIDTALYFAANDAARLADALFVSTEKRDRRTGSTSSSSKPTRPVRTSPVSSNIACEKSACDASVSARRSPHPWV